MDLIKPIENLWYVQGRRNWGGGGLRFLLGGARGAEVPFEL
jgi:hypothetical protein